MLDYLRRDQHLPATPARKSRNRHAPDALSGNAPVRAIQNHPVDSLTPTRRNPLNVVINLLQRLLAEIVLLHRDEPLICRSEDHGVLASPAMRVGVRLLVVNSIQKQALLFELLDDERIRLKDITSLKLRYLVCEAAPVIHRGEHL